MTKQPTRQVGPSPSTGMEVAGESSARRRSGRQSLKPVAGVVLLSGKTASFTEDLRAIENVYSVKGVHRVASELKTVEN